MDINGICNVDNLNKAVFSNEASKDNNYSKNVADDPISMMNNKDYAEFSIDYSNDDVKKSLSNILDSFDIINNIGDNRTIADCADEYGKILKSINSNTKIDDKTKETVTKILDDSFDRFANKKAKFISERVSAFFNGSYISKECRKENGTSDLGITGDKLIDEDSTENNIRNMFTAVRVFYKNNLDGTKEQLDKYLEGKFDKTESIDKLSYDDFKCLEKSVVLNLDIGNGRNAKEKAAEMNKSLEDLKKAGASEVLTDTYNKARYQNNNKNIRIEAFGKLRFSYEKRLEVIGALIDSNSNKLKELDNKRKKMIEDYNKKIEKMKKDMLKLAMLKINAQDKILKELEKTHSRQLENIEKLKTQIEEQQNQLGEEYSETSNSYKQFLKDPTAEISEYISAPENKL